jgi:hypothetical protein
VDITATVNDDAWLVDAEGDYQGYLQNGTPNDSPGGFATVESTEKGGGKLAVDYGDGKGAAEAVDARISDEKGDSGLASYAEKIAPKLQHGMLEAAEQFWRSGNCVRADVIEDPVSIDLGDKSTVTVEAVSKFDDSVIHPARAEHTGTITGTAGGTILEAGRKETTAAFTYQAARLDGYAQPEFRVISRRGVGTGKAGIEVGQTGWVINDDYADVHMSATKCNGLVGRWDIVVTSDWGYDARVGLTIDNQLLGTWDGEWSYGGFAASGSAGAWLEARDGAYVLKVSHDPMELPIRPATAGECS